MRSEEKERVGCSETHHDYYYYYCYYYVVIIIIVVVVNAGENRQFAAVLVRPRGQGAVRR
jgi:hypothetical protein